MVVAAAAAACVRTRWRREAGLVAVGGVAVLDVPRRAEAGDLGEVAAAAGAPVAAAGVAAEVQCALQLLVELLASHGEGSWASEGVAAAVVEVVKGTRTVAPPLQTAETAVLVTSLAPRQQQQQSESQR